MDARVVPRARVLAARRRRQGKRGRPGSQVEKTAKNRWRVQTGGASSVTVRYRVYGREMGVRTNFIEADFALINGAATFLTLADDTGPRAHEVALTLPAAWKTTMTGLPGAADGLPHHYLAADFDTLVDSPIVAGNPAVYEFSVKGKPHFLVNVGEGGVWDGPRSAADAQRIVETQAAFWGHLPYDKYVFINMITEGTGGLEHRNSTVLMTSRWRTRDAPRLRGLALAGQPRVLPRLEREASAAGGAGAVRVRARELHEDALGRRGPDRLLRRPAGRARRRHHPRRVSRGAQRDDREPADNARPAVAVG